MAAATPIRWCLNASGPVERDIATVECSPDGLAQFDGRDGGGDPHTNITSIPAAGRAGPDHNHGVGGDIATIELSSTASAARRLVQLDG